MFVAINYVCFGDGYFLSALFKFVSFFLGFAIAFPVSIFKLYKDISYEDFLVSLDMKYKRSHTSPFQKNYTASQLDEWKQFTDNYVQSFRNKYKKKFKDLFRNIGLVTLSLAVLLSLNSTLLVKVESGFSSMLNSLFRGFSIEIVDGEVHEKDKGRMSLSSRSIKKMTVLDSNLIKISANGFWDEQPKLIFETDGLNKSKQVFQMLPVYDNGYSSKATGFEISFSAEKSGKIYISSLSDDAVVDIEVKKLPIPELRLEAITDIDETLSDDEPLELQISVQAKNPLASVKLKIDVNGKSYEELVTEVFGGG